VFTWPCAEALEFAEEPDTCVVWFAFALASAWPTATALPETDADVWATAPKLNKPMTAINIHKLFIISLLL
jgi:hypothetical protein